MREGKLHVTPSSCLQGRRPQDDNGTADGCCVMSIVFFCFSRSDGYAMFTVSECAVHLRVTLPKILCFLCFHEIQCSCMHLHWMFPFRRSSCVLRYMWPSQNMRDRKVQYTVSIRRVYDAHHSGRPWQSKARVRGLHPSLPSACGTMTCGQQCVNKSTWCVGWYNSWSVSEVVWRRKSCATCTDRYYAYGCVVCETWGGMSGSIV